MPNLSALPRYPVVKFPSRLTAALEFVPELPPYLPPVPLEDAFPPDIPLGRALVSGLLSMFRQYTLAAAVLAPDHLEARRRYEAALETYQQKKAEHDAVEAAKITPEELRVRRDPKVAAQLESSQPESVLESQARMGAAESHLYQRLAAHFPNLVLRRRMLRTGAGEFHPDYLLFDPRTRLRLDIELDEPYNLRLKAPIHFVEWNAAAGAYLPLDVARDEAFLTAGWVVVRFSETQAVEDPDGCARVVADVLRQVTGQDTPSLKDTLPVKPEARWTREHANVMAADDTRFKLLAELEAVPEAPRVQDAKPRKVFTPSENQQRIYDFLLGGTGHGLVVAVAGSGKSTTLLESVKVIRANQPRARIVMLAFNRSIRQELKAKLQDAGFTDVQTATLNGFGNMVIRADKGRSARLRKFKDRGMLKDAARELGVTLKPEELLDAAEMYSKFQSYCRLDPKSTEDFQRLASMYKVRGALPLQPVVVRALERSVEAYQRDGTYTLDEQNYLPVRLNLEFQTYDFVFVDECQDLTQTQLQMVIRAAGENGRLLFVGDPKQAIMGFRGADNDSVESIKAMESAPTELPLTVCYRCPASHIRLAQAVMPLIQAAPGAKEGDVWELPWEDAFGYVREGDLLFSKTNVLVQRIVLELLARGITLKYTPGTNPGAAAEGADEEARDAAGKVEEMMARLRIAAEAFDPKRAPVRKPQVAENDKQLDALLVWTLGMLHRQAQQWDGSEFTKYVEMMTRPDERMGVNVCSGHQSKGLEADRVFVMGFQLFGSGHGADLPWEVAQADNLKYVALTRAKDTLYLVEAPKYQ